MSILLVVEMILGRLPYSTDILHFMVESYVPGEEREETEGEREGGREEGERERGEEERKRDYIVLVSSILVTR